MRSNQEYVERLRQAVEKLQGCSATHNATVFVHIESLWQGDVEVFELLGHPVAEKCYAWLDLRLISGAESDCFAFLHGASVTSAKEAVQASLAGTTESGRAAA
jgi:hypothetical protein